MNMHSQTVADDTCSPFSRSGGRAGPRSIAWREAAAASALVIALSVIWITLSGVTPAHAKGRVALLLGAETYQNFKSSAISKAQTEALGNALKAQGFDVTIVTNPVNAAARAALSEFSRKTPGAEFALVVAAGHFATYRRQSFFLPTNARVRRSTDLFSRGLAVSSLADIASRAKAGSVFVMVTVPDIPSTVAGVTARPDLATALPGHISVVFSTSDKVPVSSVDKVSAAAMTNLIEAAKAPQVLLSAIAEKASAASGRVFGKISDIDLSAEVELVKEPEKPVPDAIRALEQQAERELAEARRAQELAEARKKAQDLVGEAERRARLAEERARALEAKAQRELAAARAAQAAAAAAVEARKAEAERDAKAAPAEPTDLASLQVLEGLLGRSQRQTIQRLLRDKGYYDGAIDGIFGDRTRAAIKAFQKDSGAADTGYMTPNQFQKLVAAR